MKIGSLVAGLVFSLTFAALPAAAHELQYKAVLDGPSEAPPNTSPGFGTALTVFLAPLFATFFGTDGTPDFFALIERVILAMIGIY